MHAHGSHPLVFLPHVNPDAVGNLFLMKGFGPAVSAHRQDLETDPNGISESIGVMGGKVAVNAPLDLTAGCIHLDGFCDRHAAVGLNPDVAVKQ